MMIIMTSVDHKCHPYLYTDRWSMISSQFYKWLYLYMDKLLKTASCESPLSYGCRRTPRLHSLLFRDARRHRWWCRNLGANADAYMWLTSIFCETTMRHLKHAWIMEYHMCVQLYAKIHIAFEIWPVTSLAGPLSSVVRASRWISCNDKGWDRGLVIWFIRQKWKLHAQNEHA